MKTKIVLLVALAFFSTGCSDEKAQLRNAILHYNTLLSEGYRTMNMSHMVTIATEQQALKVYHYMAALGEGGVRMDPFLRNISFEELTRKESAKAEVITRETWNYRYMNTETGEPGKESIVNYKIRYSLVKLESKWLVADLLVLSTDKADDSDLLPFLQRPSRPPRENSVPPDTGNMTREK